MYTQSLSFSPKNSSSSRNEFSFSNLSIIDWKMFAEKVKQYVIKLNSLIHQKLNQTETTVTQEKNTNEFKQLTWSKIKFCKDLNQLIENMFGDQSRCDSMLQRVHKTQHQFYWSTNEEYRGYSEIQGYIRESKANDAFDESDSHKESEQEYMKIKNWLAKVTAVNLTN